MKSILVLGHKGMLGQMVCKYFGNKPGFSVYTTDYRFNESEKQMFLEECASTKYEIVINCIGKIKQKTDNLNDLLMANAVLPLALVEHLRASQTLIHPSTDCVFDGKKGSPYEVKQGADAIDAYGWSKRLGETAVSERKNTILVRVSIIGPDNNPKGKGLLNWFLSNDAGSKLNGFTNHYWNGITTLEWCKKVEGFLSEMSKSEFYFYQLGTKESYTKFEMLNIFQEVFNTDYKIEETETTEGIDRRLGANPKSQDLRRQLIELKDVI